MVVHPYNIGIQIKRKELTKPFMMIYPLVSLYGLYENIL